MKIYDNLKEGQKIVLYRNGEDLGIAYEFHNAEFGPSAVSIDRREVIDLQLFDGSVSALDADNLG